MPHFRIDTPYGAPIPESPPTVKSVAVGLDGADRMRFRTLDLSEQHPLPHEATVRLLPTTDPDDPESLLRLCSQVGPLQMPDYIPGLTFDAVDQLIPDLTGLSERWSELSGGWSEDEEFWIALDEIRMTTRVIRALVDHWTLHVGDRDPRQAWRSLAPADQIDYTSAWATFGFGVNALLQPFSPAIGVVQEPAAKQWAFDGAAASLLQPILANFLALDLYNAIVEAVEPRICPECGTQFLRQDGRAKHDQHRRTGVLYCSSTCARRKAGRESKRRKRAEGREQ